MKYSTYIFDLDGTLINTLDDLTNAINFAMREMSYPERTIDEVRSFVGNGIKKLVERAVPIGINEDDFEKTHDIFSKYYVEHIADFTRPYDGVIEAVKRLKDRGCKTAVVTNKEHNAAQIVVREFFGDLFDVVVGKMDGFQPKPSPEVVFYAIKKLSVEKEDCVYVGDSDVDVQTAHNAGLPCIGVTWGFRDREVLEREKAEYIIDNPNEIK